MEIRCLGKVRIDEVRIIKFTPAYGDAESREPKGDMDGKEMMVGGGVFESGGNYYVPITGANKAERSKGANEIELALENALERSREEPQIIGQVKESDYGSSNIDAMINRLWLYDGKIYQLRRNDYNKEQVRLLILDYLGKEEAKFKTLEKKFEKK